MSAVDHVARWLADERATYASKKWAAPAAAKAHLDALRCVGPTTWHDWAGNYLRRAAMFRLDTALGRQALGKTIVTLIHFLESAVEEYGPMPAPGEPSGEVREWDAGAPVARDAMDAEAVTEIDRLTALVDDLTERERVAVDGEELYRGLYNDRCAGRPV